jgi:cytochrome c biogenesis protein ResB
MSEGGADGNGRTAWAISDIERQLQDDIRRRMAERDLYIKQSDDEYMKRCEQIEFQIESYVNSRYNKDATAIYVIGAILIASYYFIPMYSAWWFIAFVAASAVMPILNWREQRRSRAMILKMRKQCVEPTFKDRELALFAEYDLTSSDETRDDNRRMLLVLEMRYRNRYGSEP